MSEYQYYEFLALDRPLTRDEQNDVGSLSTRARITATGFTNEYQWGDFRGDPDKLMDRYYDAHLYVANWGTRRVMFRLPRTLLDPEIAGEYCLDDQAVSRTSGEFTVLDFTSEDEEGAYDYEDDGSGQLSSLVGVRAELASGDLRPLYLAWLASRSIWDLDPEMFEEELEPPVPPGLNTLSAAQQALAGFLRVDEDLLETAARTSPPIKTARKDLRALATWVEHLPETGKNQYLLRILQGEAVRVGAELQRLYHDNSAPAAAAPSRRTVTALFEATAQVRKERALRWAAERAEAEALREQKQAQRREQRLNVLASEGDIAWSRVDALIATRKPAEYGTAATLLSDLKAIAEQQDQLESFKTRISTLRHVHARKVSLIDRLEQAGI